MELILIISISYLMGSIPFGLILTKVFLKKDIREIGSGNIGATNVLRTGNKYLAALTLALDVFKGYVPVYVSLLFYSDLIYFSSLMTLLGHIFPVWLKFKGGKGVATYLGIITALSVQLCFLFIFTWVIVFLIFKYSSLSSMFASLTVFIINFLRETVISSNSTLELTSNNVASEILFIFLILIIFTHRKNIMNLKNKTENKIKI